MNKAFLKELFLWIESSNNEELLERKKKIETEIETGLYNRSEMNLVIKLIDEELLTSLCLAEGSNKKTT